ncbi:hypothetical protein N0V88_003292 [Collariella sp. IMI 366227]|nr:hypothetical protein N0V88_003292 [Collariella sp. IMI 366227]
MRASLLVASATLASASSRLECLPPTSATGATPPPPRPTQPQPRGRRRRPPPRSAQPSPPPSPPCPSSRAKPSQTATPRLPLPCFTDTTTEITHCPIQTTGPSSGKKLSCYPTAMTSAKCREGLICQADVQGNPSCMYKHSGLGVDGIVIAIVFAAAVAISIVAICFMCCRERREHKKIERAAEAAKIAKERRGCCGRPAVDVSGGGTG